MPWLEVSTMSERVNFFNLWESQSHTVSELCRLFGISRKTGYKWIKRGLEQGVDHLQDQSKRAKTSPIKTSEAVEKAIIRVRKKYPDWGGRKIKRVLENKGATRLPAVSTITEILRRNGLLEEKQRNVDKGIRFEHEFPNSLWQMDFKGHFALSRGQGRCHPLTVLDDHSRFNIVLKASFRETREVVENALIEAFERYGLPDRMTMDNGSPWGHKSAGGYTKLTVWLMDLGVKVSHSRPYHPQTQGKDERFHRTLKAEVLSRQDFSCLKHCQKAFDEWVNIYNYIRPHDGLNLEVPATRYTVSDRPYQGSNTNYDYSEEDIVRKVNRSGTISYKSQKCFLGEAFAGRWVAVKRTIQQQNYEVYYRHQRIAKLCLDV